MIVKLLYNDDRAITQNFLAYFANNTFMFLERTTDMNWLILSDL